MRSSVNCFLVVIIALTQCCKSCFGFASTAAPTKHHDCIRSIHHLMTFTSKDTNLFVSSSHEETNHCELALVAADGLPSNSGMTPLFKDNQKATASVTGTAHHQNDRHHLLGSRSQPPSSSSSTKLQLQSSPVDFALLGSMACLAAIVTLAWVATDSPLVQDIENDGSAATFIVDAVFASLATIVSLVSGNDVTSDS